MKKKDVIALIVSIVIFMVAGGLIYRFMVPPPKNTGIKVEIPHKVTVTFDAETIKVLSDTQNGVTDFTPSIEPDQNSKPTPVVQ